MSKEAMKLALDEFKHIKQWCLRSIGIGLVNEKVLAALEEALAKQEQGEPVAWIYEDERIGYRALEWKENVLGYRGVWKKIPLYTTPQQRTWVGLTDQEFQVICTKFRTAHGGWVNMLALEIEAKLKEKNNA